MPEEIAWTSSIRQGQIGLKKMDSEAVFQVVEANPVSSNWRVSGEYSILLSIVVRHFHNLNKSTRICQIMTLITKLLQNF